MAVTSPLPAQTPCANADISLSSFCLLLVVALLWVVFKPCTLFILGIGTCSCGGSHCEYFVICVRESPAAAQKLPASAVSS